MKNDIDTVEKEADNMIQVIKEEEDIVIEWFEQVKELDIHQKSSIVQVKRAVEKYLQQPEILFPWAVEISNATKELWKWNLWGKLEFLVAYLVSTKNPLWVVLPFPKNTNPYIRTKKNHWLLQ